MLKGHLIGVGNWGVRACGVGLRRVGDNCIILEAASPIALFPFGEGGGE